MRHALRPPPINPPSPPPPGWHEPRGAGGTTRYREQNKMIRKIVATLALAGGLSALGATQAQPAHADNVIEGIAPGCSANASEEMTKTTRGHDRVHHHLVYRCPLKMPPARGWRNFSVTTYGQQCYVSQIVVRGARLTKCPRWVNQVIDVDTEYVTTRTHRIVHVYAHMPIDWGVPFAYRFKYRLNYTRVNGVPYRDYYTHFVTWRQSPHLVATGW